MASVLLILILSSAYKLAFLDEEFGASATEAALPEQKKVRKKPRPKQNEVSL